METNRYTMRKSFVLIIAALLVAACGNRKGEQQEMAAGACQDTACAQLPDNPQEQLCAAIGDYLVNEIEERMRRALYPNPQGNYYCYVFDEEVQLSTRINLPDIVLNAKSSADYVDGMPIFMTGEELMKYKK